jgi:hypothetical protein
MAAYDQIFADFMKVIEGFGVTKVESVGQPFDFNFMEAIMTAPRCVQMPALCALFTGGSHRALSLFAPAQHRVQGGHCVHRVPGGCACFPLRAVHCPLT